MSRPMLYWRYEIYGSSKVHYRTYRGRVLLDCNRCRGGFKFSAQLHLVKMLVPNGKTKKWLPDWLQPVKMPGYGSSSMVFGSESVILETSCIRTRMDVDPDSGGKKAEIYILKCRLAYERFFKDFFFFMLHIDEGYFGFLLKTGFLNFFP